MGHSRSDAGPNEQTPDETVGRRALLRRAATVAAAGIGGVAAAEMLSAGPASAAQNDPVLAGQSTAAGPNVTTLSSTVDGPTLELDNNNGAHHGTNLRLAPVDTSAAYVGTAQLAGGELLNLTEQVGLATTDTLYWLAGPAAGTDNLANLTVVLTTATGTVFAPVPPSRLLDTRYSTTRHRVQNLSALDSHGRLIGGQSVEIDVSDLVGFAYSIHFNVTATQETTGGYLTVYPGGTKPNVSNLNFTKGVTIANSGLSPLSDNTSIFIYASQTTHVLLDLQGWTLPDFSYLTNAIGSDIAPQTAAKAKARSIFPARSPKGTNL